MHTTGIVRGALSLFGIPSPLWIPVLRLTRPPFQSSKFLHLELVAGRQRCAQSRKFDQASHDKSTPEAKGDQGKKEWGARSIGTGRTNWRPSRVIFFSGRHRFTFTLKKRLMILGSEVDFFAFVSGTDVTL
jgi:hypothetical protein